jgi:hypothetical protein
MFNVAPPPSIAHPMSREFSSPDGPLLIVAQQASHEIIPPPNKFLNHHTDEHPKLNHWP